MVGLDRKVMAIEVTVKFFYTKNDSKPFTVKLRVVTFSTVQCSGSISNWPSSITCERTAPRPY